MRASISRPYSLAELQYLMYLHYCKGMFRVSVDVNITQSNRLKKYLLLVSDVLTFFPTRQNFLPRLTAHAHCYAEQQYLLYLHYCKGMFRVGVDVNITQSNR